SLDPLGQVGLVVSLDTLETEGHAQQEDFESVDIAFLFSPLRLVEELRGTHTSSVYAPFQQVDSRAPAGVCAPGRISQDLVDPGDQSELGQFKRARQVRLRNGFPAGLLDPRPSLRHDLVGSACLTQEKPVQKLEDLLKDRHHHVGKCVCHLRQLPRESPRGRRLGQRRRSQRLFTTKTANWRLTVLSVVGLVRASICGLKNLPRSSLNRRPRVLVRTTSFQYSGVRTISK